MKECKLVLVSEMTKTERHAAIGVSLKGKHVRFESLTRPALMFSSPTECKFAMQHDPIMDVIDGKLYFECVDTGERIFWKEVKFSLNWHDDMVDAVTYSSLTTGTGVRFAK